jgi:hypothetical protein
VELWGGGTASASTDAGVWDSQTTIPQYVGAPVVQLSFAPRFFCDSASGAATPVGIAWRVGNVDSATPPDLSALPWVKARVVIVITKAGHVAKTMSCGWRLTCHGLRGPDALKTLRCALPRGRYRFTVEAEDLVGNWATEVGSNRLTVL